MDFHPENSQRILGNEAKIEPRMRASQQKPVSFITCKKVLNIVKRTVLELFNATGRSLEIGKRSALVYEIVFTGNGLQSRERIVNACNVDSHSNILT